jgi:hypothetical protein
MDNIISRAKITTIMASSRNPTYLPLSSELTIEEEEPPDLSQFSELTIEEEVEDPDAFPQFSRFPNEIKLQIFEHTLTPRCIKLGMANWTNKSYDYLLIPGIEEEPLILQINRLTRNEFLPRYPKLFQGQYKKLGFTKTKPYSIRFNSALDTLAYHHQHEVYNETCLIPIRTVLDFSFKAPTADLSAIQCLSVELQQLKNGVEFTTVWRYTGDFESLGFFRKFSNLKTLLIVNTGNKEIRTLNQLVENPIEKVRTELVKTEGKRLKDEEEGPSSWRAPVAGSVICAFPAWSEEDYKDRPYLNQGWHWAAGLEKRIVARREVVEAEELERQIVARRQVVEAEEKREVVSSVGEVGGTGSQG